MAYFFCLIVSRGVKRPRGRFASLDASLALREDAIVRAVVQPLGGYDNSRRRAVASAVQSTASSGDSSINF